MYQIRRAQETPACLVLPHSGPILGPWAVFLSYSKIMLEFYLTFGRICFVYEHRIFRCLTQEQMHTDFRRENFKGKVLFGELCVYRSTLLLKLVLKKALKFTEADAYTFL